MGLPAWMRRSPSPDPVPAAAVPPPLRPPRPAGWWIVPLGLLIGAVVFGVAWWLLAAPAVSSGGTPVPGVTAGPAPPEPGGNLVQVRSEVLRTALAAGAGIGAAVTLMLAFRRQRHQEIATLITSHYAERTAEHTERDAAERRVTELYTKAAEQLGHDKAAVRLAGLYALERLAQDNPGHRQTIVNVICAYLRMPYSPPTLAPEPVQAPPARSAPPSNDRWLHPPTPGNEETPLPEQPAAGKTDDAEGERQVRLTAQRILGEHLRDERTPSERDSGQSADVRFWDGMRLELTGATLIDLDLQHCRVVKADFGGAAFVGDARFKKATFARDARFEKATFAGEAGFGGATFTGHVGFGGATFGGVAVFGWATFDGIARFEEATFTRHALFIEATFTGFSRFEEATFTGEAWFDRARFTEDAGFGGTNARVLRPDRDHVWPTGWAVAEQSDGTGRLRRLWRQEDPEPDAPGPGAAGGVPTPDAEGGEDHGVPEADPVG
ncbi:pentapeptide repeat-containing protein [Planomonospora sp. ID82291]|uniref:pentapeptide repeat-containing protein n=1 Tax=Planomonospora sp. ID82291 TaxID=2738136 RepID=UPI0018C3E213|nr:pentapeptide repeat-containing protein [Planomonospora sp. ID82291]MBG0819074.1 pentapeptide repeat-containing protein [Planomonospora sp. ID82291]